MAVSEFDGTRLREAAFAAADLFVSIDLAGRILQAEGDAALLHHPTADRLITKNALELICEGELRRLREEIWALGPGQRLAWEDRGSESSIEGGRRIVVQRSASAANSFTLVLSRFPRTSEIRVDRAQDVLADRFRHVVMNGGLMAARQPIVDTRTGEISHYEVLARFGADESPAALIGAAEKSGQISHLDYIMVHAAASRLAENLDPALRLAVDISAESLQRPEVVKELCAVLAGHRFRRNRLILEITESAEIRDIEAAAQAVSTLRASGVSVSLDDFGSGSASFDCLRRLDVDELKFDGSFLKSPEKNRRGLALMRSVARMCAELGISSVGERVETEADRDLLVEAGVRYAQGYFFGTPKIDETFFNRCAPAMRSAA